MKILAYRSGALGDTIVTLPTLQALARAYEGAEITLVGTASTVSFLAGRSAVHSGLSADLGLWASYFGEENPARLPALPAAYDLALAWSSDHRFCENLRRQVPDVRQCSPMMSPGRGNAAVQLAGVLHEQERLFFSPHAEIAPKPDDSRRARELLEREGRRTDGQPLLVIHPGAGSVHKRWPSDAFQDAANAWTREGGKVCITVGPADRDLPEFSAISNGVFTLREPDLPLLAGVLESSDAYLGNDSGISHLAAALGCRGIVCFGPTDPDVWAPSSERIVVFRNAASPEDRPDVPVNCVISQLMTMKSTTPRASGKRR